MTVVLALSATPALAAKKQLALAAGTVGGTFFALSSGIVEVFNKATQEFGMTATTGGGTSNPMRVGIGKAEFGFTFSNFAFLAQKGRGPYKKAYPKMRSVIRLYGSVLHQYIARSLYDKGIHSWNDIIAKKYPVKVGPGKKGTSTEWFIQTILGFHNLTYGDIKKWGGTVYHMGVGAMSSQFADRHMDLWFHNAGPGNAAGKRAALSRPLTFMQMPANLESKLLGLGAVRANIPPGTYHGQDKVVKSVGLSGVIISRTDVPEKAVYIFVKSIMTNKKYLSGVHKLFRTLDPKISSRNVGIALHPGAVRAFNELGGQLP
jgi:hypothetical protein